MLRWPFLLIIALAPLPLGSNRPIPWTLLALAIGLLLLAWGARAAWRPAPTVLEPEQLWPALLGLGLVVLVALLQMAPYVPRDWQHPLWLQAAGALGAEARGRISVNPHVTGTALMLLLTNAGAFWLALQLGREPGGARRIVQALVIVGCAYALYGLIVHLLGLGMVLWWRKWTWMAGLTSSFVNRNTYATYAGLGLLCAVGLLITTVYRDLRSRRFQRLPWRVRLARLTWRGWWLVGAALALALALILTGSRAGVASTAVALAALLASFGLTRLMRARDVQIVGGLALALGALVFALGGDDLVERLEQKGVGDESRLVTYQRVAAATLDAPWLGTGYGTFPEVYQAYQAGATNDYWNHAHDTYLENAFELGIPAAAALVGAIGWLAWGCARSLRRRRANALYPCLGVAATVLVGLHAVLDFSLEIPAVAVTYATLLGVAYGRARRTAGVTDRVPRRSASMWPRARPWLAPGLAALVAAGILGLALPRLVAELIGLPAGLAERQLEAGLQPRLGELDRAIEAGRAAAAWADASASWLRVARAELTLADRPGMSPNARRSRLQLADEAYRHALAQAPANPVGWAQLAYVALARNAAPADIGAALRLSVLTGPSLGGVMPLRSTVAALAWRRLDARTRALFEIQFVKTMQFAPQPFVEAIRRTEGAQVVHTQLKDEPALRDELDRLLLILGRQ